MKLMRFVNFIILVIFISCSSNSKKDEVVAVDAEVSDGTHCADVTYYNPNSGTKNTYTLNVEVQNNELTKIYWGNGGWLDDSHFQPEELDRNKYCSFTSDRGYKYEVEITGNECTTTDMPTGEAEKEKPVFRLTLGQCASTIPMTEDELVEYETTFGRNRSDMISEEMCQLMYKYVTDIRPIKKRREEFNRQVNDGYIEQVFIKSSGDILICNLTIVKRNNLHYLLEVNGSEKSTMGLMEFDPAVNGWQDVIITQDPSKMEKEVYQMRVIDTDSELSNLKFKLDQFCNN